MLNVICAVIGALLFVGLFLSLFRGNLVLGIFLLPVLLVVALLVAVYSLSKEVKSLQERMQALEDKLMEQSGKEACTEEK